jgi:hypothetical protein
MLVEVGLAEVLGEVLHTYQKTCGSHFSKKVKNRNYAYISERCGVDISLPS